MKDVRFELLAVLLVWLATTVYTGLGLWRGNSIARLLFLFLLVAVLLVETFARQRLMELPVVAAISGLVAWYLYAKPNIELFFEATWQYAALVASNGCLWPKAARHFA